MPTSSTVIRNTAKLLKTNAPEILTALGVSGVVTTSYLSARASFKAAAKLNEEPEGSWTPFKEKAKKVWKCYIPATISGAATIGCIIAAGRGSSRRVAAAATAYSLTERAFSEYREKVVEQIGLNKEQQIRDDLAQEKVSKRPPPESSQVVLVGPGQVLCCEAYTGRYFRSDMETLRKAQNDINARIMKEMYVNLDEFYDLVGLDPTSNSDLTGWNFERLMELDFSSCLTPTGDPCLSFQYNYVKPL